MKHAGQAAMQEGNSGGDFAASLVEVWREACRHIEIDQSTAAICQLLAAHLPVDQFLVRKFDRSKLALDTIAWGFAGANRQSGDAVATCTPAQVEALLAWSEREEPACITPQDAPQHPLGFLVPEATAGCAIAGPLGELGNPAGVLLVTVRDGEPFNQSHLRLFRALWEPFSTALENDQRLREMAAMRAAAEADRASLLKRLGRKAIADSVVGAESGLHGVMERVELAAPSDVPVLILGETGTGKELIARLIHTRSHRAAGPFLRVNCGAIPMELIDSQLFGHERGAFTGAVESRQGWFERADGGTLLLDEIGELPLAAQVRLLRILQDGWLERVGGTSSVHVDVRIVAATHRNLASMVAEGKFREDLWYRIAVFPILLPPLRERREDIADLARHFAERAAVRFSLPLAMPTPDDIRLLHEYPWPGNIRELAAVIDRAAILGNGRQLEIAKSLGVGAGHVVAYPQPQASSPPTTVPASPGEIVSLDEAMKAHIEKALAAVGGRIEGRSGAAALLKINPHTLRARMRKLKIDWARFRERE